MKLRLDTNKTYALALEGGGAKGAYQIGVCQALQENGIRINAVAGTSVGALNGALIAMGDLDKAADIWRSIRYSQVIDTDDQVMHKLICGDLRGLDLRAAAEQMKAVLRNRGFDVTPLYSWLKEVVDEDRLRASDTELYIVTYSLSDGKELELRAKDLPAGSICDMLLASAYLPVFRNEKLGGKRYADGGLRDVLPLHVLLQNGCKDIIAVRLYGVGLTRRVRIPKDAQISTIAPREDLGGTLRFEAQQSAKNITLGYFDAMRMLYDLQGKNWYVDASLSEEEAYDILLRHVRCYLAGRSVSLRSIHEDILPTLAKRLEVKTGDYHALLLACLEVAAETAGLDRWRIYTEQELIDLLSFSPAAACPPPIASALKGCKSIK